MRYQLRVLTLIMLLDFLKANTILGTRLLTLTNYKGFDPEVSQYGGSATVQGIDYGTYPQSKSYVVGFNVEF